MAEKTVYMLDGALQLFKRGGTHNWQCSFSITGKGQLRRSTGTDDLTKAKKKAKEIYFKLNGKAEAGLDPSAHNFTKVADLYLQNIERKVSRGEKTPKDLKDITGVVTRYFTPYFESFAIDAIQDEDIENYKEWRKDYWLTGPGAKIDKIPFYRDGVRHAMYRPARHEVPSLSRQNQEFSMLRQLFKYASTKRFVDRRALPEIKADPVKNNEGAGITEDELSTLLTHSLSRIAETKHGYTRRRREMLHYFIKIATLTGMRPTEIYRLTWGDIEHFTPLAPDRHHGFDIEGLPTQTNPDTNETVTTTEDLLIYARGKGKHRCFVPDSEVHLWFHQLHKLWLQEFETPPTPDDPIFFNKEGEKIDSFKNGLNALFTEAGVLHDREGRKRTAYCFRHYYITKKLEKKIDPYVVAVNVGTSVKMLEQTYSHVVPKMYAKDLRK